MHASSPAAVCVPYGGVGAAGGGSRSGGGPTYFSEVGFLICPPSWFVVGAAAPPSSVPLPPHSPFDRQRPKTNKKQMAAPRASHRNKPPIDRSDPNKRMRRLSSLLPVAFLLLVLVVPAAESFLLAAPRRAVVLVRPCADRQHTHTHHMWQSYDGTKAYTGPRVCDSNHPRPIQSHRQTRQGPQSPGPPRQPPPP